MNDTPSKTASLVLAFLRGQYPFVICFGCLLLLNWGMAFWLVHTSWQERQDAAFQLVTDEAKYAEFKIATVLREADSALLDLRASYPGGGLEQWTRSGHAGEIALIAPDGHVVASTPHATTAGWPRLMAQLANGPDVLAIGEPVPADSGHMGFLPIARRVSGPDGSFAGILLFAVESEAFPELSAAVKALDGCLSFVADDGLILSRAPDMRGTVGMRMVWNNGAPPVHAYGMGRALSPIDGIDRIFAYRRVGGLPATVIVGISYDATFAGWQTLRWIAICTRLAASLVILLTAWLWYTRRRRANISVAALSAILNSLDRGVRVENADGKVVAANAAGESLHMPDGTAQSTEVRRPDGGIVQITRHDVADGGTVLIGNDVTALHAARERIDFLTGHDVLTGLPNRRLAASRIEASIAAKAGSARIGALILLDLDGFQDINDTLGHEGGDDVLTEIARRLRELAGDRDVVARLGGDEFLLFLDDPAGEDAVMDLARHVPRTLARPIQVRGQQVRLGASMGMALHPRDGADLTTLFRHADIALSRAKQAGRGTAQRFDPHMMAAFEEHRMMESDLRRALDGDELELRLQPQFACATLEVTGFEALARWRHPIRGELLPAVFIPVAEHSGLINPLGLWAIEQACKAAAGWRTRHRVAVNVSPLQLRCETIQDDIRAILRRTQFPAHLLELEVTESVLLDEDQRTLETLHKLRALDIRVTLDDFGAGYSSLSYMRRFPFDKIKIDKSFIQTLGSDRGTKVILEAMIRLCTDLGFDVVAEGVETQQQLAELRQLGLREVQGFLLGEPMRPEMVETFLADHEFRRASRKVGFVGSAGVTR